MLPQTSSSGLGLAKPLYPVLAPLVLQAPESFSQVGGRFFVFFHLSQKNGQELQGLGRGLSGKGPRGPLGPKGP